MTSFILLILPILSFLITIFYGIVTLRKDFDISTQQKFAAKRRKSSEKISFREQRAKLYEQKYGARNKDGKYLNTKKWLVRESILNFIFIAIIAIYVIFFADDKRAAIETGLAPFITILVSLLFKIRSDSDDLLTLFQESADFKALRSVVPLVLGCVFLSLCIRYASVDISKLLSFDIDYLQLIFWLVAIFIVGQAIIRFILNIWKYNDYD